MDLKRLNAEVDTRLTKMSGGQGEKKVSDYRGCQICEYFEDAAGDVKKFRVYHNNHKIADRLPDLRAAKEFVDETGGGT